MSADKNPIEDAVEQALDTFVYAPIGLLFDGPARFPKLVRNGRTQVTNARMVGQFAVKMGRTEVEKRARDLEGPVTEVLRSVGLAPEPSVPAPTPTVTNEATATEETGTAGRTPAKKTPTKKTGARKAATRKAGKKSGTTKTTARKRATGKKAAKKAGARSGGTKKAPAKRAPAVPPVASLPIPDYDSLSASQVVSRLRGLEPDALEAVRRYESANRARKTVLSRAQQIQKR